MHFYLDKCCTFVDDGGLNVERGDQSPNRVRFASTIKPLSPLTDDYDNQNRLELLQPEARIGKSFIEICKHFIVKLSHLYIHLP